ncbi:NADH dehydrogenase [ubiquinone] 1 beta subcomplex subunit 7 [Athalia rosae]|uniref:NADH dehydrogenase [ubiquinone] 1 beta subcomplex subunit 7 n=1 Tax=Athalia rosae TaxID=37344 RepID=UPI00203454D1|nr:NADH dehydrogenase [ubiquinone] 1 beta subcomplex subunit 7 [Athalia rosae]
MGNTWAYYVSHPDTTPPSITPPTFDPLLGFSNGRKPRVMVATEEEMKSANLALKDRDYCAHHLLAYQACRADVWPLAYKCAHERHVLFNCQYDDFVLTMKEYERERRLLQRQKRIQQATAA